jgi:hypothetical protein
MKYLITITKAIKEVLDKRNYVLLFLVISFIMASVLVLIPVISIPGNGVLFQLSLFTFKDYIILVPLSLLVGLMIAMQIYGHKLRTSLRGSGRGVVASSSGILAGIFGTAGCSSCIATVFSFLGTGSVLFLIANQWYIVGISSLIVLLSIYFTSVNIRRINED